MSDLVPLPKKKQFCWGIPVIIAVTRQLYSVTAGRPGCAHAGARSWGQIRI